MHNERVELRHLRSFIAVAQELHFSRAAKKLHIAQPALSQQILQLEQILGARLFERTHHMVRLTNVGQLFLKDALQILEQVDLSLLRVQQAQNGQRGRLDIGFVNAEIATANIIPEVLTIYCQRFPAVEVQLKEMYLQEQLQALKKQQIQVGFAAAFQDLPGELDAEVLQHVPYVAAFSSRHRFARQQSISLSALIEEPFFFCPRQSDSGVLYERIAQICGVNPRVIQEVSNIHIMLGLIAANLGVSLVAASATTLPFPGVMYRPLSDINHNIAFRTVLLWQRDDLSPLLREFLIVAREVFAQRKKTLPSFEVWETSAGDIRKEGGFSQSL
ncbi:LysR family transcriptional regulator [Ktedonosporobacter rubrisoli]|uniref:LysR family transcriptional regulator n=1 Tax=Ktedonosporobacter rubrisoli TaxID=2509675 RepID=A0A4P6JYY4_KTERU|nr:LysR substrate-binding domain-containing protein [Ktedonosporobacter rubrisoli]QBD80967.1 LysR family transcriptional regulator [Ktedonosporobacter rubrisoli]